MFKYPYFLIKEIMIWLKVRSVAKENEPLLLKSGFRVDWVGRIYTVINLPEEIINQPISREGYVLMKLREYDKLFLDIGIADYVSPELVELENTDAYLLILCPDRDFFKFWPFVKFLSRFTFLVIVFIFFYRIINKNFDILYQYFNRLIHYI